MNLSAAAANALAQSAAIAAIVTMLIGYLRPFVEQLPFARPSAPTHDATLRLMNLLLNLAGVLALAAASGGLAASDWLPLGIQTLAMAAGSHIIFHTVTSSAGSAGEGASVTPPTGPAVAPASPVAPASRSSAATAAVADVASAVDSAIAAAQRSDPSGQAGQ